MKILMLGHTTPASGSTGVSVGIARYMFNHAIELNKIHDVTLAVRDKAVTDPDFVKTVVSQKLSWFLWDKGCATKRGIKCEC